MKKPKLNRRVFLIAFLFTAVTLFFFALIGYDMTSAETDPVNGEALKTYSMTVEGTRGDILDANGNYLVYNQPVNTLVFDYLSFPADQKDRNRVLEKLIRYLEEQNETWLDPLPLEFDESGTLCFKKKQDSEIRKLKSADFLDVNSYATPQNCLDVLAEKYQLDEKDPVMALKIASVCYGMQREGFSAYHPYTFADDVSIDTVSYIKENSYMFPGVNGSVTSKRKYIGDGTIAAHILGMTGSISAEEYNEEKAKTEEALAAPGVTEEQAQKIKAHSYTFNDVIGKSGIESVMEDYLRGDRGTKTVTVNPDGTTDENYSYPPSQGNTVILTIDQHLQEIADASLRKRILEISEEQSEAIAKGLTPAGAVVVQDVTNGAILAAASYPNFSLTTYYEDYNDLAKDPGKPLWNRAFQSAYSPGSTMKPCIAVAALEEGAIGLNDGVYCAGTYQYYDITFACYNNTEHGYVDVETALEYSCNIFFYEMAKRLGIDKMNKYATLFGLGEKTGVEINEAKGILAGPKRRDELGLRWQSGETLLAAIGQSDNSFTPIQLCNYVATIANGGTRYVPYLVERVTSADLTQTVYLHKPKVAVNTNIAESTLQAVKKGMYLVANEGSCYDTLGHLAYTVACKTGTAEKTRIIDGRYVEGTDGFLITFGPYDDAKIAITVVVENAGSGSSTAQVAADIYDYYFSTLNNDNTLQDENVLLW